MASNALDVRIRALVDGVREVQQLTDDVEELQREGRQEIPDNSRRMRKGLTQTDREAKQLNATMDRLKGLVAGIASAATFAALAGQAREAALEIQQATRQARAFGTTTAEIQGLTFALRQFGADQTEVADAIGTLSDRAEDAKAGMQSFIDDFRLLGVEVEDLRGKDPVELFRLMAERVAQIEDPTRRAAGVVRIFGDDLGRKLLPLLIQGAERLDELSDQAERVGATLNEEQAQNVAAMNREFRALRETLDAQFTQAVGEFSEELRGAAEAVKIFLGGGTTADQLQRIRDILSEREGEGGLFGQLRSMVALGRGGGIPTEDLREAERVLEQRLQRQRSVSGVDPALRALFAGGPSGGDGGDSADADGDGDGTEIIERAAPGFGQPGSFQRMPGSQQALERHRDALRAAEGAVEDTRTATERYNARVDELRMLLERGYIDQQTFNRAVGQAKTELDEAGEQAEETGEELSEFAIQAARSMQSAFADFLFDPFENGIEGMADQFVVALRRMAAEAAAASILDSIFDPGEGGGGGSDATSGFAAFLGSLFGEAHTGGVVGETAFRQRSASPLAWAGAPRMHMGGIAGDEVPIIARKGEEILPPDNPRHRDNAGGGGTTVVQNITTPDAQSFRRSRSAIRRDAQLAMGRR